MQLLTVLAILAYFLYALCAILDKHIVSNTTLKPISYAFYSGFFQILYIIAIPFVALAAPSIKFEFPETEIALLAIADGALFIFALLALYKATSEGEISRISPIIGILVPIFTFIMSAVFLHEDLASNEQLAFVFFILGGFLISARIDGMSFTYVKGMVPAAMAGFLFAAYYVLMDYLFAGMGFIECFLLLQFGGFIGALLLLSTAKNRKEIFAVAGKKTESKKGTHGLAVFIADKGLAAVAALLIYYAIMIGSATMVNSLQAVQYAFVLILTLLLSIKAPNRLKEDTRWGVVLQKAVALALTARGLMLIA